MGDFSDWYNSIPYFTKYWFTLSTVVPLLERLGIVNAYLMLLDWKLFFYKFQVKNLSLLII